MRKRFIFHLLKSSVLEVALAFHRLGIIILAQDVLIRMHVDSAKIPEPCFNPLFALHHFFSEVICIDIDTNGADDPEFLAQNRNSGALELPRANVELIVQLVLVQKLTLL